MNIFWLVVIGIGLYVLFKFLGKSSGGNTSKASPRHQTPINSGNVTSNAWLDERWVLAERQRGTIGSIFPPWYFDSMTERQANRLEKEGRQYSRSLTKGQASDLIGLKEPADEEDLEVLKHFKCSTRGMNQTRARHEVALIFQSEENQRLWEVRPTSSRQKEFFRFFKIKPQAGLTKVEADKLIKTTLLELQAASDVRVEHWRIYEDLLDEFDDPEFRDGYDLKKPSYAQIREAVDALLKNNHTWVELDNADIVVERLIEMKPDLEK